MKEKGRLLHTGVPFTGARQLDWTYCLAWYYYSSIMASERVQRTIERLLDEAEDAISRSDWSVVRDRAQNVLALDHENPDALAFLEAAEFALNSSGASSSVQPPPDPVQARVSDQPTSFANGRYQVDRFLGEGGKKMVYLAQDRLLEMLDEALSSRVVEELPQSVGRYQFTHALIQETLAEELSITRRVRLHARIAKTLEGVIVNPKATHRDARKVTHSWVL